ncbi:uncharacterized protein LOC143254331 isoform X3 [Tachypleus tridentatus]|uniref:uncharacterized protein LOC143254331 isoform X3 n=1 Tax=Tachypleus tridentatus TaxID=6853 RepID=UPI003FD45C45
MTNSETNSKSQFNHCKYDQTSTSGYSSDATPDVKAPIKRKYTKKSYVEMKALLPPEETTSLGLLSPILSCFQGIGIKSTELLAGQNDPILKPGSFKDLNTKPIVKNGEGFCIVLSLQDGSTLYVTSSISAILGYPKDMLIGQCFVNFLYPRDQVVFASYLTQGLNAHFTEGKKGACESSSFYCRIRKYQGLKSGYGVSEKKPQYQPFHTMLHVKEVCNDSTCVEESDRAMCLVATFVPVKSAYNVPDEIPTMSSFSTRHSMACYFSHVDSSAIPYLGYVPQDMVGNSVFDFYHMDDLPQMKDIYELVMKEQGCPFRSKPYRFRVFNGCYITMETEWSCFINPWTKKLEFVVGQHRVLKGPEDPNVLNEKQEEGNPVSEELLKASHQIQEEIVHLLSQPVKTILGSLCKVHGFKRKLALANLTSNLVDKLGRTRTVGEPHTLHAQIPSQPKYHRGRAECQDITAAYADQASVVMGEISPHQETHDSDPSTATPSSVQEMRYQENIERFFASQPKTYSSDGSGESKSEERPNTSTDEEIGKCSGSSEDKERQLSSDSPGSAARFEVGVSGGSAKRKLSSKGDSGNGSFPLRNGVQKMDTGNGSSSDGSAKGNNIHFTVHSLTEEALSQHNRMTQKFFKPWKGKISGISSSTLKEKDALRHKRSQTKEHALGSHKHKPARNYTPTTSTSTTVTPTQTEQKSDPIQPSGMLYMGFNVPPPFSLPSFPVMTPTAPVNTSANITCGTTSFTNSGFTTTIPNFGYPPYTFMPQTNTAGGTPGPFFMPGVMCVGAMPFYPSLPTVIPQPGSHLWPPCGAMPNVGVTSCGQPAAYNGENYPVSFEQQMFNPSVPFNVNTTNQLDETKTTEKTRVSQELQDASAHLSDPGFTKVYSESPCEVQKVTSSEDGTKRGVLRSNAHLPATRRGKSSSVESDTELVQPKLMRVGLSNKNDKDEKNSDESSEKDLQEDTVSFSITSSLLKSDGYSSRSPSEKAEEMEVDTKEESKKLPRPVRGDPPWTEGIDMGPDTVFLYQLPIRNMEDVLKKDLEILQHTKQSELVNKQLAQLQSELEEEGQLQTVCCPGTSLNEKIESELKTYINLGFSTFEEDLDEEMEHQEEATIQLLSGDI